MTKIYDVIIVGAGPAGMAAAIYTGRAMLDTLVLEKGIHGGQILLTDWIENYPGFPDGVAPFQLMEDFRKQAEKFGAKFQVDEVKEIRRENDCWRLESNNGSYLAKRVIIATGSGYQKLGVKGEKRLTGKGVSYCATCDAAFFRDKEVAVVGGGDQALEEAIFLSKFCRKVIIIHRRDEFRATKILQERIFANKKIKVIWDSVATEILGEGRVESLAVKNIKTGAISEIKLDGVFISVGMAPNTGFLKGLLDLDEQGRIKVSPIMATSQPGIFAAGDATNACPQQVATAVGTGVAAAISASKELELQ
ncbi:MAG: thioredoxin-disulfide reductase [Candidatus Aminicenantes bacterium]|nr:thioredoxin-disulfide reductase [Candidatus Aminicenantes bacterium]